MQYGELIFLFVARLFSVAVLHNLHFEKQKKNTHLLETRIIRIILSPTTHSDFGCASTLFALISFSSKNKVKAQISKHSQIGVSA